MYNQTDFVFQLITQASGWSCWCCWCSMETFAAQTFWIWTVWVDDAWLGGSLLPLFSTFAGLPNIWWNIYQQLKKKGIPTNCQAELASWLKLEKKANRVWNRCLVSRALGSPFRAWSQCERRCGDIANPERMRRGSCAMEFLKPCFVGQSWKRLYRRACHDKTAQSNRTKRHLDAMWPAARIAAAVLLSTCALTVFFVALPFELPFWSLSALACCVMQLEFYWLHQGQQLQKKLSCA